MPESAGGDSFDFSPVLLGKDVGDPIRRTAILQNGHSLLAFRNGDWKLRFTETLEWQDQNVKFPGAPFELYNLADDPLEQSDLAEKMPERVAEMKSSLMDLVDKGRTREERSSWVRASTSFTVSRCQDIVYKLNSR